MECLDPSITIQIQSIHFATPTSNARLSTDEVDKNIWNAIYLQVSDLDRVVFSWELQSLDGTGNLFIMLF